MKCLNSSTTDASKNITNNIYNMALVVAMRKKEWKRENSVLTLPKTIINTALQNQCIQPCVWWCRVKRRPQATTVNLDNNPTGHYFSLLNSQLTCARNFQLIPQSCWFKLGLNNAALSTKKQVLICDHFKLEEKNIKCGNVIILHLNPKCKNSHNIYSLHLLSLNLKCKK